MAIGFRLRLQDWYKEGKPLPGYEYMNGGPYLAWLLGKSKSPSHYDVGDFPLLEESNPALEGPNGWTVLQMLIARKGLK